MQGFLLTLLYVLVKLVLWFLSIPPEIWIWPQC
jgi:hypothetical protein